MPDPNISYAGQLLIRPGVYAADNVSAVPNNSSVTTQPLIFIAAGYGGEPQMAYSVFDPASLYSMLRGAPAAEFVQFLYSGSSEINGAQEVIYINVSPSDQSTATIYDSASSGVVTLTSLDYGTPSNLLQYTTAPGTVSGVKLTLLDGYSKQSITGDNLGVPFALAYTGTATSGVSYTVQTSSAGATNFVVTSPNSGESFNLPLSSSTYPTVQSIANFLAGTGFYSAYVVSDSSLPSTSLDGVTSVTLSPPTLVAGLSEYSYVNVTSVLGDIVYWVNRFSGLATAAVPTGITSSSGITIPNVSNVFFTGATNGSPALSDYQTALTNSLSISASVVFCDTNLLGVPTIGSQNAVLASQVSNGNPRRFVTGSSLGDTVSIAAMAARSYNAIQTTYVYQGVYRTSDISGSKTLYSGLYDAAAVAGMMAGNDPWIPITNKSINAISMEKTLSTGDINTLQQAGVMPVAISNVTKVPVVISDMTTWQNDSNAENMFNQQVAERQALQRAIIQGLQPYIGSPVAATPKVAGMVKNAVKRILNNNTYSDSHGGLISSWDPTTLVASYTGSSQSWYISVDVVLVGQTRFITFMANIQPLNLTLTA